MKSLSLKEYKGVYLIRHHKRFNINVRVEKDNEKCESKVE